MSATNAAAWCGAFYRTAGSDALKVFEGNLKTNANIQFPLYVMQKFTCNAFCLNYVD